MLDAGYWMLVEDPAGGDKKFSLMHVNIKNSFGAPFLLIE